MLMVGSYMANAQRLEPNPNALSKLKEKRILVIDDKVWNKFHLVPKDSTLNIFKRIDEKVGFASFTVTENASKITLTELNNYDVVIFNYCENLFNAKGGAFEAALKGWFAAGNRGYMGYHTSGQFGKETNNTSTEEWPWYQDSVLAMRMTGKDGPHSKGIIKRTEDPEILALPIMDGLPAINDNSNNLGHGDEWISFDLPPNPNAAPLWVDCKVLYNLDESTCNPKLKHPMGDIHPVMWIREDARENRFFFAGQFHDTNKNSALSDFWNNVLLRALEYVAGERTTSNSSNKKTILTAKGLSYVTKSRQLKVDLDGAYQISVLTSVGKQLYSTKGEGKMIFTPSAFATAGNYIVQLESKGTTTSLQVQIY